jgi:trehalose-phosphatase
MTRHLLEEATADLADFATRERLVLAFDFDGTLSPIAPTPQAARIDPAADEALRRLLARADATVRVGVASGRRVENLRPLVPPVDFLIGLHGLEIALGGGDARLRFDTTASDAVLERLRALSADFTRGGARIEDKRHALTLHVRGLTPERAAVALAAFAEAVHLERKAGAPITALYGHASIEARPATAGKQHAIGDVVRDFGGGALAFVGDDASDEEVFRAFPAEMTVVVMDPTRDTAARYFLRSPRETAAMIGRLTDLRAAAKTR